MSTEPRPDEPSPELTAGSGDVAEPRHRRPSRRRWWVIGTAAAAAAAIALTGAILVATGDSETLLEAAKEECAADTADVRIGDDGASMTISGVAAEEAEGASIIELLCIFDHVQVPDAVISHMDSTRALDGRQEAAWGDFTASWTYHPNSGLNVIIQEAG